MGRSMEKFDGATWFPLDRFEVGIDAETAVVALGLYQVRSAAGDSTMCGSTMTPTRAERIGNALLIAANRARLTIPGSSSSQ